VRQIHSPENYGNRKINYTLGVKSNKVLNYSYFNSYSIVDKIYSWFPCPQIIYIQNDRHGDGFQK